MKTENSSERVWHKTGETKKGEAIYRSTLGHFAVVRDHNYLSQMTEQEIADMKRDTDS